MVGKDFRSLRRSERAGRGPKAATAHPDCGRGEIGIGHVLGQNGKPQRSRTVRPRRFLEEMAGCAVLQCRHYGPCSCTYRCRRTAAGDSPHLRTFEEKQGPAGHPGNGCRRGGRPREPHQLPATLLRLSRANPAPSGGRPHSVLSPAGNTDVALVVTIVRSIHLEQWYWWLPSFEAFTWNSGIHRVSTDAARGTRTAASRAFFSIMNHNGPGR